MAMSSHVAEWVAPSGFAYTKAMNKHETCTYVKYLWNQTWDPLLMDFINYAFYDDDDLAIVISAFLLIDLWECIRET